MKIKQLTKKSLYVAVPTLFALSSPMTAHATNGYFSAGYGTKSKSVAGAGVANPEDAIAAATNPAGMFAVGNRLDFGAEIFSPDRTATTRNDSRTYDGNGDDNFLIPEFGWTTRLSDTTAFGISVYANGGMNTKYESIAQYSGGDGNPTGVNLAQLFVAPTFAMKVGDSNQIGVSVNLIYQTFEATGLAGFAGFKDPAKAGGSAGLSDQGEDTSTGTSVKIGWLSNISDDLTFGFSYQTKSSMSKFSKYNQLFAQEGGFDIPSTWTAGFKAKMSPAFTFLADVQRINYTDVASISNPNKFSGGAGTSDGTGYLGSNNGIGFGWDDMTIAKFGAIFALSSKTQLRMGYSHGQQPIGADDTAFNLIAPAVIEDHYTIGASFKMGNSSDLTAYYMRATGPDVQGSTTGAGTSGNANLSMTQNAVGVAYGWSY